MGGAPSEFTVRADGTATLRSGYVVFSEFRCLFTFGIPRAPVSNLSDPVGSQARSAQQLLYFYEALAHT